MPDADVALWTRRGEQSTTSGADGHYRLEVTTGTWQARASAGTDLLARVQTVRVDAAPRRARPRGRAPGPGPRRGPRARPSGRRRDRGATTPATAPCEDALDATFGRTAVTDAGGRYALAVPGGEVRLQAIADGRLGHRKLPAVAPGADVEADLELQAMRSIDGRVVDRAGRPVAGAHVIAFTAVYDIDLNAHQTVDSDADGRFRVVDLAPGALTLDARTDAGGASEARMYDLSRGDLHDLTLTLAPPTPLTGQVSYGDGSPAHGVEIRVIRVGVANTFARTSTDTDGGFSVAVPAGARLEVEAHNEYGHAHAQGVVAGTPVALVIHVPGGIRGVVHRGKAPATDYTVSIDRFVPAGAAHPRGGATSRRYAAADGRFEWAQLDPGTYDLSVRADGAAPAHARGVVVPDAKWAEVALDLTAGARLTGRVHGRDGRPIGNARVDAACTGASTVTAADGSFTLRDLPARPCAITVTADGFAVTKVAGKPGTRARRRARAGDRRRLGPGVTRRGRAAPAAMAAVAAAWAALFAYLASIEPVLHDGWPHVLALASRPLSPGSLGPRHHRRLAARQPAPRPVADLPGLRARPLPRRARGRRRARHRARDVRPRPRALAPAARPGRHRPADRPGRADLAVRPGRRADVDLPAVHRELRLGVRGDPVAGRALPPRAGPAGAGRRALAPRGAPRRSRCWCSAGSPGCATSTPARRRWSRSAPAPRCSGAAIGAGGGGRSPA